MPMCVDDSRQTVELWLAICKPQSDVCVCVCCRSFFDDKHLCIVTEYCENGDLASEIRARKEAERAYTEDEVMDKFVQVLLGLAHIHNNRILHRDLKSQNIFIGSGGAIKVGDLGIARVLEHTLEQCKSVVGSPYYMAPEGATRCSATSIQMLLCSCAH